MEQQQWSEWIEWKGGECPIPHAKAGEWWWRIGEAPAARPSVKDAADDRDWNSGSLYQITAYRVRLTAQQPTEPATTESDRDIDIGDGVAE